MAIYNPITKKEIIRFLLEETETQSHQDALYYFGEDLKKYSLQELLENKVCYDPDPENWINEEDAQAFLKPTLDMIKKEALQEGFTEEEAEYASLFLSSFSGLCLPNPLAETLDKSTDLVEWINSYEF